MGKRQAFWGICRWHWNAGDRPGGSGSAVHQQLWCTGSLGLQARWVPSEANTQRLEDLTGGPNDPSPLVLEGLDICAQHGPKHGGQLMCDKRPFTCHFDWETVRWCTYFHSWPFGPAIRTSAPRRCEPGEGPEQPVQERKTAATIQRERPGDPAGTAMFDGKSPAVYGKRLVGISRCVW